ncbi:DUF2382 domain-containing protein [Streptomyces sp. NPDC008150]|uniref:PRC and DUF2382 domain-containing protein n=1 Tax=Streptomyces sp. NPDC008150 TaxID=3364816 RepID=UPI0036F139B2
MITQEQIPAVLGHAVFDSDGNKIGEAKHVFLDDATGMPEWVSVKTGWFGSSESFVPTREAALAGDHLEVPYAKDKVKGAPNVDIDSGGHLSEDEEHRLYDYYGVAWDQAWARANRPGGDGWAATPAAGAAGAVGAAAATSGDRDTGTDLDKDRDATGTDAGMDAGVTDTGTGAGGYRGLTDEADLTADADLAARPGMVGDMPTGAVVDDDATIRSGLDADGSMTRSEERMRVGVERHEAGRARLRKYVVSEEVEQSVPLRHEEVYVVREPITQADRDAALTGPEIMEAEQEVTLYEERPVVETEAVAVERVRLSVEEHTETETVHGRVRKERIDTEGIEMEGTDEIGDGDTFRRPEMP